MENETNAFAELGSINSYAERQAVDPRAPETLTDYTAELAQRREVVARTIGIDVDELHIKPLATAE